MYFAADLCGANYRNATGADYRATANPGSSHAAGSAHAAPAGD